MAGGFSEDCGPLGNKYRVCGIYSPEPRAGVYCVRLNFNISKLVYCEDLAFQLERAGSIKITTSVFL